MAPAALLLGLILTATSCTGQTPPPPASPTPTAPPSSASPTPTPSPTPTSARERALADSKQTYIDYTRALDRLGQAGGADQLPDYLERYLTPDGPARKFHEKASKDDLMGGFKRTGFASLRDIRILDLDDLDAAAPEVQWRACVDQSKVVVTKNGSRFEHPKYLMEQVWLRLDKSSGRWLVHDFTTELPPDGEGCEGGR